MLITQAFGWMLAFSWWWIFLPVGIWFVSACIISGLDNRNLKKGLPTSDDTGYKTGYAAFHGIVTGLCMCLVVIIPLLNIAMSIGPHYGDIANDIESQFNLEYVTHTWIGDAYDGEYKWVAKDPDGLFVMCNTEKTKSEDTFKFVCDSGKDYQKENAHG